MKNIWETERIERSISYVKIIKKELAGKYNVRQIKTYEIKTDEMSKPVITINSLVGSKEEINFKFDKVDSDNTIKNVNAQSLFVKDGKAVVSATASNATTLNEYKNIIKNVDNIRNFIMPPLK